MRNGLPNRLKRREDVDGAFETWTGEASGSLERGHWRDDRMNNPDAT